MSCYIKVNNDKKKVKDIFANINGVKRKIVSGWCSENGVVKKVFGKESTLLFAVYLALLFVRNINHPLLIISGEYGAAKTTFSRMIAKIIDISNFIIAINREF